MKKINKSHPPNALTTYAVSYPNNDWDNDFRNDQNGITYKTIKNLIFSDQGYLCAYCETQISNNTPNKQRVEHFHPKSDKSNSAINWSLDWNNVIGVCLGGEDADRSKHVLPANLSCDAYKNHLVNKNKLPTACEGHLINPLQMLAFPCLFTLNRGTGELKPNIEKCMQVVFEDNQYPTTVELIEKTIEYFNLNCDRLNQDRVAVIRQYNKEVKKARLRNDKNCFSKLASQWFQNQWPSYFTTRRILLEHHDENMFAELEF
ncbi:MAG: retron Ec78 anti-phage system effector HNH endonuclease PtuB [Methylovulum miyakonense]|uniref:retron Ec78 anti-phage system effector HNH endonuclease PtuB n=1 Tax=Methylovulum miyakonense TaxID=645578 RepID=UPI003BB5039B